jgi:hypothetical protein
MLHRFLPHSLLPPAAPASAALLQEIKSSARSQGVFPTAPCPTSLTSRPRAPPLSVLHRRRPVVRPLPSLRCTVVPSTAMEQLLPLPCVAPLPHIPCVAPSCATLLFLLYVVANRGTTGRAPLVPVLRRQLRLGHLCVAPSHGDGAPVWDGFPKGAGTVENLPPPQVLAGAGGCVPAGTGMGGLSPTVNSPLPSLELHRCNFPILS